MMRIRKLEFLKWGLWVFGFLRCWMPPPVFAGLIVVSVASSMACDRTIPDRLRCAQGEVVDNPNCQEEPVAITAVPVDCESTGGTCVHEAPDGWFGPNLYWIGPYDENPGCPPEAPLPGSNAYADLGPVVHSCPSCDCGPSGTTCLPSSTWTVSAAKCSDAENAVQTPFDVLVPDWAGACNPDNPVPAGALCGEVPCAQSVTVSAPQAISAPCAPEAIGQEEKPGAPWPWGLVAQECLVTPSDTCAGTEKGEGRTCVPTPGDFLACISLDHGDHEGDVDCPPYYDEPHTLYRTVEDNRACSPCGCGDASGGACAVTAVAYEDGRCQDFMVGGVIFSGDGQACFDISSGAALGSKSAEVELLVEGSCRPKGGEALGGVEPAGRVTLCCHHDVSR
jgi:hypothetical protein